jgi:hypothetical protein
MINNTQLQFLDDMLGSEGTLYETIIDINGFNLGTKSLYLERAITEDCQTFLMSLDKLYDGADNCLELIRNLKTINDLCFNHPMKFGEHGLRSALNHYFSKIGPNPLLAEFQPVIRQHIQDRLVQLQQGHEQQVLHERQARQAMEPNISGQSSWRTLLDLPSEQLIYQANSGAFFVQSPIINIQHNHVIQYDDLESLLGDIEPTQELTQEEIEQLNPATHQLILSHPEKIHQLRSQYNLSFEQLQALNPDDLAVLITYFTTLEILIEQGDVSFDEMIALPLALKIEFLSHMPDIFYLTSSGIELSQLQNLAPQLREELFHHAKPIRMVLSLELTTFPDIVAMDAGERSAYLMQARLLEQKLDFLNIEVYDADVPAKYLGI